MSMVRGLGLALCLVAPAAVADEAQPPVVGDSFVVRNFEANKSAAEHTQGLTALLATRMTEARLKVVSEEDIVKALGLTRQRELLGGCTGETQCATELADAMGARYVVSGRVDRFSEKLLLSASVWDQNKTEVRVKAQREVGDAGLLPQAMAEIADELLAPFGVPPKVDVKLNEKLNPLGFNLGLKVGTTLLTSLFRLAPSGDVELGFRITLAWLVFLQVGFGIAFDQTTQTNVGLTPGLLGLRYSFRTDKSLQPSVGGGLGVISTISTVQGKSRLSANLLIGVAYLVTQHVSAGLEVSADVLGLSYAVAEKTSPLTGVNLNLSLGLTYRF